MLAYQAHPAGECAHGLEYVFALEVTQHVMAVVDRFDIVQRVVEERREVILLASVRERRQDLIQMQVTEEIGLLRGVDAVRGVVEQDAVKRRD